MKKLHIAAGILAGTLLLTALAGCTGKDPSVDTDTSWEAEASLSSTDGRETSDTTETQTETVTTVPEADHPESSVPQETQSDPGPTETEETERPAPPLVTPPEESQPETPEMDYRVLYRQAWDAAMRRESGSQEITLAAVMDIAGQTMTYKQFGRLECTGFSMDDELLMTGYEEVDGMRMPMLMYYRDHMAYLGLGELKLRLPIASEEELSTLLNGENSEDSGVDFQEACFSDISLLREENGCQTLTLTCKDDIAERLAAELLEPLGITKEYYQALSISEVSCTAQIEKGALKNISCELNCMAELIDAATGQTVSASFAFAMETAYSLPGEAVNLVPPDDLDSYRSAEELV